MLPSGIAPGTNPPARQAWWREAEVLWLVLLVVVAYFSRAGVLPLRGEEPTRAQIAREMVERGDWVVPREQGEPFLIRPPLQGWVIAASCLSLGSWEPWAVRFPSVLATLLTSLLVYGYSRTFLSRSGALAAGVAFATLPEMFQMGRQAETEAIFVFLLGSSLILWHWGVIRHWPEVLTYSLGYGLMALATLAKGIQAPVYFVGSLGVYLVVTGQWRRLFGRANLLGALVGASILLAWVIPYSRTMGWWGVRVVWFGDPAVTANASIRQWPLGEMALHLVRYPLELVAGMLPWSLLLLFFLYRDFRRAVAAAPPQVLFVGVCLGVAFPTCWIPPGGLPRYFAPLFPCVAVLIGLAVQHAAASRPSSAVRTTWRRFLGLAAGAMVVTAAAVLGVAAVGPSGPLLAPFAEPLPVAVGYALAAVAMAYLTLRAREGGDASRVRTAVLALAGFLVLTFTGVSTDVRLRKSENAAEAMKRLKEKLPPGQPLVSINGFRGHTDSLFAYLYGTPFITPRPGFADEPASEEETYFCFIALGDRPPQLPFPWEEVGAVSMDRNHHPVPERMIVVGRRLPTQPGSLSPAPARAMGMPHGLP